MNWSISFSKYERLLVNYYSTVDKEFMSNVAIARQILQEEKNLQEIVQLVGKDSLGEEQKISLEIAKLLREDYLQQNGFSNYDYTCPLVKCAGMIRNFVYFYTMSQKAVKSKNTDTQITWNKIAKTLRNDYVGLTDMKFILPNQDEQIIKQKLDELHHSITKNFNELMQS